jgi:hypothetical protein
VHHFPDGLFLGLKRLAWGSVSALPASIETLPGKLDLFRRLWARERGVDQLDGGSVDDVAVGIVLDLQTLLPRGEGALGKIAA